MDKIKFSWGEPLKRWSIETVSGISINKDAPFVFINTSYLKDKSIAKDEVKMSEKYISDSEIIVKLQGIKYVEKSDVIKANKETLYLIKIQYKGSELIKGYQFKSDRDAIYDQIRTALKGD